MPTHDSFGARSTLQVGDKLVTLYRLAAVMKPHPAAMRLPYSLKILLECLLRTEDGVAVTKDDIASLADWDPKREPDKEIAFTPSRVLLRCATR
jgi:aconitate hydratase